MSCYIFRKITKTSKDKRVDIRNMPIGMSKKVYKGMVKEMDKIASQEEKSKKQRALNFLITT